MLAALVSGKVDLADVLFLVAFIVFCVVFLLRVMATPRAVDTVLVAAGLALVSLAWFVL
jgi:hypothetical protein